MNDKSLGIIVITLGFIGVFLYLYWLFAPANPRWLYICEFIDPPTRWALILPILIAVVGILAVAMWIGWTMIITPSPIETRLEENSSNLAES